ACAGQEWVRLAAHAAGREALPHGVVDLEGRLEVTGLAGRSGDSGERKRHEAVAEEADVVALAPQELLLGAVGGEQVGRVTAGRVTAGRVAAGRVAAGSPAAGRPLTGD